jgi:hypothetical protein
MEQGLSPVTVLATFNDRVSAEIACALLAEASIHSDEPEAAEDGSWLVSVRRVHPDLAGRAKVILKSARARETTIASNERQTTYVFSESRNTVDVSDQGNVPPTVLQEAFSHSLPGTGQALPSCASAADR